MMRITIHPDEAPRRVQFEGRLSGAWVAEAEDAWRVAQVAGQPLVVDLTALTAVDDAGWRLLRAMHAAGASFLAEGVKMKALLKEMTKPGIGRSTSGIKRK